MSHPCAVVADTKTHAQAIIAWLGLDPDQWQPITYGQRLSTAFDHVRIVRPLSGVMPEHLDWIAKVLIPKVARTKTTVPDFWEPTGSIDRDDPTGFATMW